MTEFKNIVLATDLSWNSDAANPFAAALAKRSDGTVHIVHSFEGVQKDALAAGVVIGSSAWLHSICQEREKDVASFAAGFAARFDVKTDALTVSGHPAAELVKFAGRCHADLIVIATHGRTGLTHLMLGSVAERVLRTSPIPVLTVRPGETPFDAKSKFKTVLMPTDFSENAADAEPYAAALASKDGAKLAIVHVVDDTIYYTASLESGAAMMDTEGWIDSMRAEAEVRLSNIGNAITERTGVKCEQIIARGRVAEQICAIAKTQKADMIVISTHGYSGLSHLVFGSVAEKIIRMSHVPVLSVKPKAIVDRN